MAYTNGYLKVADSSLPKVKSHKQQRVVKNQKANQRRNRESNPRSRKKNNNQRFFLEVLSFLSVAHATMAMASAKIAKVK